MVQNNYKKKIKIRFTNREKHSNIQLGGIVDKRKNKKKVKKLQKWTFGKERQENSGEV